MNWTDNQTETWVGIMLRTGVFLAAVLVMAGGILLMVRPEQHSQPDYAHFYGQPHPFTSIRKIVHGAGRLDPESVIMLGLVVLVATPVARVGMCVVSFSLERDGMYVVVSTVVLLILIYSLVFHR